MKAHKWVTFCFTLLLAAQTLIAEAAKINRTAISNRVMKYTESEFGADAVRRIVVWRMLIEDNKDKPIAEKLTLTNKFINRIPIKSETELWGHIQWSTPYEMLVRNGGSHADHAIAKYVTLEALGVPIQDMQLTHAHSASAATLEDSYMVLTYSSSPNDMPLVLDTINSEIKPGNERNDLIPEESINDDAMWLTKKQSEGGHDELAELTAHKKLWQEVITRIDQERLFSEDQSMMLKLNDIHR